MKPQQKFFNFWFLLFFAITILTIITKSKYLLDAILIMLAILGCVMSVDLIRDAYFSLASKNWPTTKSHIKSSKINYSTSLDQESSGYIINFNIEYLVDGKNYKYEHNAPVFKNEQQAKDYLLQVESGKKLSTIYYNPNMPHQSYIEPGLKLHHILGIPIGLGLILIPILTLTGNLKW